ncbi:MAG: hypothetical protein HYV09_03865, partial [Deltaproteobacteria bacterium]|nr:hypothetical protein [Deltaproteobacteria bacterium]
MSSARVLVFCALVSTGCRRPPPDEGAGAIESPDAGEARDAEGDAAESSTTWELDVGCRPPPAVTSPRVRACDGATCLFAHGKKMKLADGVEACAGTLFGERVQHLGMERYSVVHCTEAGVQITIVDLEKQAVLGSARAPAGQKNVWTDTLRASSGEAHPFIAPSYGDASPVDPTYGVGATWGHACVYDPTRASDLARCGPGFASFDVRPPSPFFREAGGYVMDLDGDGLD